MKLTKENPNAGSRPERNQSTPTTIRCTWLTGSTFELQPLQVMVKSGLRPKREVDLIKAAADFKALSNELLGLWSDIFGWRVVTIWHSLYAK